MELLCQELGLALGDGGFPGPLSQKIQVLGKFWGEKIELCGFSSGHFILELFWGSFEWKELWDVRPVGPGLGFEGWRLPSAPQQNPGFGEVFGEKIKIFFRLLHPAAFWCFTV